MLNNFCKLWNFLHTILVISKSSILPPINASDWKFRIKFNDNNNTRLIFIGYIPAYEDKQEKQSFSQQQWTNVPLNWSKEFEQQQHPVNLFKLHPAKTSIIKQKIEKFYAPTIGEQLVHLHFSRITILRIYPQNYVKQTMEHECTN